MLLSWEEFYCKQFQTCSEKYGTLPFLTSVSSKMRHTVDLEAAGKRSAIIFGHFLNFELIFFSISPNLFQSSHINRFCMVKDAQLDPQIGFLSILSVFFFIL